MTETNQTAPTDAIIANPDATVTETTANIDETNADKSIDYKEKFSHSSSEALRLLDENRKKDAEIERLRGLAESSSGATYSNNSEALYPGFENLGEEEQKNVLAFTNTIKQNTLADIYKDPAIAFAKKSFNEQAWNEAFESTASEYP